MPFQPTYPSPYNAGVNIDSEEGVSFECTIDEYDTIYDAELFIKDVSTNSEIFSIKRNYGNNYKQIESVTCDLSKLPTELVGADLQVRFDQANLPYIYELSCEQIEGTDEYKISATLKGDDSKGTAPSPYYTYKTDGINDTYTLFNGLYNDVGYIVWGPINSFRTPYQIITKKNRTKPDYEYFFSSRISIYFKNGEPVVDGMDIGEAEKSIETIVWDYINSAEGQGINNLLEALKKTLGYLYIMPPYTAAGYKEDRTEKALYNFEVSDAYSRGYDYPHFFEDECYVRYYKEVNFTRNINSVYGSRAPSYDFNYRFCLSELFRKSI